MPALETAIRNALAADAGIVGIITGPTGLRLRPLSLDAREPRPYVTYKVTSDKSDVGLDGSIGDYSNAEFVLGIFSDDYEVAMDLSDRVRRRLDGFGQTVSGVEFAPCEFDDQTDIEEATPEGQEIPIYLRLQTYRALYRIVS